MIASTRNSGHEYHAVDGVSLPRRIEIQIPQSYLQLQLDVDRWAINQPLADAATFELPRSQLGNHPFVDMADPGFVPPGGGMPASSPAISKPAQENNVSRRLRGFPAWR